ncbi:MAG: glycoside hydrolase family 43 protein, partial [Anaerolineae bacterium]|nr:glycoside hydrolase family 43 protein [Anaerolineae bacterium]
CRVGEDYYLINSSFEFFPGLPIHHSHDLVHWRQIGHVLDRPEQLNLDGIRPSGGLYAPTIRHHNGTFYVINTLVDGPVEKGNFIVTATDPAGPWSMPYWLEDAPGIDPSLLFDDDGRAWYVGNEHVFEGYYPGHCVIWLRELDVDQMQLTGPKHVLWDGAVKGAVYAEGPHLYKINGMYYLMIAEGGTGHDHAVTIARSEAITGPYEVNPRNPILTHRHLGLDYPIVGTGHADLVATQYGEWWLVALAMRPYDGYFYNLGRETFMAPVRWEEGWPIVSPGTGRIETAYPVPNLPEHRWPTEAPTDHFEAETLGYQWNFLRTPRYAVRDDGAAVTGLVSLTERRGWLRLHLRPETLSERVNPAFVGRRQQHINFAAVTAMDFTPTSSDEVAGIVLLQNDAFHFRFVCTLDAEGSRVVRLIKRLRGVDAVIAEVPVAGGTVYLKAEAHGQAYSFYVGATPDAWTAVLEDTDGRLLSTPVAGGFTGAYIGLYASSRGQPSASHADFDWFEYWEVV